MNLEKLSKCLGDGGEIDEILPKLSSVKMSTIDEQAVNRVAILKRCVNFLHSAAANGNYIYIPPVLKFVRKANLHDLWLIAASDIILPELNGLYCSIVTEADPRSNQSPGKVNVAISPRVRRDKNAMRALCSVFETCFGFCDLPDEYNERNLGHFLRTSAAVLFGSHFQKERETLDETDYAMDELARHSSYALSNIMLTYPGIIPMAERILAKRLRGLFKFLHSSPELSINKSLILILRSLYQEYERNQSDSSKTWLALIDEEFSGTQHGTRSVLKQFKAMDLASEDVGSQAENISLKMYAGSEKERACFKSTNCSIQVKERSTKARRRVPFTEASIDWNRNTFVIHKDNELPKYWPFFLISSFHWRKGRQELHLQLDGRPGKPDINVIIRFRLQSLSDSEKATVGDRIRQIMEHVELGAKCKTKNDSRQVKKVSLAMIRGNIMGRVLSSPPGSEHEADDSNIDQWIERDSHLSSGVTGNHIFSERPPHEIYNQDPVDKHETEVAPQTSASNPSSVAKVENCFELRMFEGECNRNRNRNRNDSLYSSSIEDTRSKKSKKITTKRECKKSVAVKRLLQGFSSSEGSDKTKPSKSATHVSSPDEKFDGVEENHDTRGFVGCSAVAIQKSFQDAFCTTSMKGRTWTDAQGLVRVSKATTPFGDAQTKEVEVEDPDVDLENERSSTELSAEDERLRRNLQIVVRKMLEWKGKQSSRVLGETKVRIKDVREQGAKRDGEIVTKFASGMRKRSTLYIRKLTAMAERTNNVLLVTRKRVDSLRDNFMEGQQRLKVLKTQSKAHLRGAKKLMRKERETLGANLQRCIAKTRRRSESRAKKNSVLQSLARLLKEG